MQTRRVEICRGVEARGILSATSGFIAEAGFTHSLTPARNCTFGCTYCYVPTLRIYGDLKPEDWRRWGQFTTFKTNAAQLLRKELTRGFSAYLDPSFQNSIVERIRREARAAGHDFTIGPRGFALLAA